jgi:hypothetical protein
MLTPRYQGWGHYRDRASGVMDRVPPVLNSLREALERQLRDDSDAVDFILSYAVTPTFSDMPDDSCTD